jgi:hypothetical protein
MIFCALLQTETLYIPTNYIFRMNFLFFFIIFLNIIGYVYF